MKLFRTIVASLALPLILGVPGCRTDGPAAPELTAIAVSSLPAKTVYNMGDTFNPAGLEVTGTWSDGAEKTVTDYTLSPVDTATSGTKTVTVALGGLTAEFTVRVRQPGSAMVSIAVTALPDKTRYILGEAFDPAGLEVTGIWSDGTEEPVMGYALSQVDTATEGTKTVTVTLNSLEDTFAITVGNPVLVSIAVTSPPEKTVYRTGEAFDPAGLAVSGVYGDGAKEALMDYTLGQVDTAVAGAKIVDVTWGDFKTQFGVFVSGGNLLSIAVSQRPRGQSWGGALDLTGIEVTGIFSDLPGTPIPLTVGPANVSGYAPGALPGTQTLTITVEGRTASFATPVSALFFDYGKPRIKGQAVTGSYSVPVGRTLVLAPVRWGIGASAVYEWKVDGLVQPGAVTEYFSFKPKTRGEYTVTVSAQDGDAYAETSALVRCVERQGTYKRPRTGGSKAHTPDLFGYYPAPGQFVAGMAQYVTGEGWETVRDTTGIAKGWVFSLGAFGGSVVYGFDHSVENKPGQYSLAIPGNSFTSVEWYEGMLGWSEPGTVWVMQDENGNGLPDDTWYELAGSETGKSSAKQRYAAAYYKGGYMDNMGGSESFGYGYYQSDEFSFPQESGAYIIYGGTRLLDTLITVGGVIYTKAYEWGYVDNLGPYFRISDAIQADGSPANLDYIDFVRVQTAVLKHAGILGEVSTECGIAFDYEMDH